MSSTYDHLSDLAPERVRPLRRVEYERLVSMGAFEDERVELLDGVIVEMSPHGPPHATAITRLNKLLVQRVGDSAEVRVQVSFAASEFSEPEPDFAIVPLGAYHEAHPDTALLLIEVSGSSLRKDRSTKASIYARASVPYYWIVNTTDQYIEIYATPRNGSYTSTTVARPGETLRLEGLPGVEIPVAEIFR
jgi:Uma2 family endonuclease